MLLNPRVNFRAIYGAGHPDVGNHAAVLAGFEQIQTALAGGCVGHLVALAFERGTQERDDGSFIFDNQNTHGFVEKVTSLETHRKLCSQ